MIQKKTPPCTTPEKKDPKALRVEKRPTETLEEALAHKSLQPSVQAALTLSDYSKAFGEISLDTLVNDLVKQCELANKGDLSRTEALLIAQAHTLDGIFHMLARRATRVEYLKQLDLNLRLALKAQSQCRATLETLAAIKNPQPVAFVRQANIAHGPQQVNNTEAATPSRAEESKNQPNKVLENQHGKRMDLETSGETSRADSSLETVAAIHRTQDIGG